MERLEGAVAEITVGDPLDESTEMGPLISEDQRETVASYVPDDAPVAIRGSAPDGPGLLVPADGALPGGATTTAPRARRSSARWRA